MENESSMSSLIALEDSSFYPGCGFLRNNFRKDVGALRALERSNKMKVIVSKDKEHVAAIRKALKENLGYCPCSFVKSPDTKCMCREFKERKTPGLCHCGLYEKVED